MTHDDPADEREAAAARSLAEALERRGSGQAADAQDAAELISASRSAALGDTRSAEVLQRLHTALDARARAARHRGLSLGFAGALAAAAALIVIMRPEHAPAPPAPLLSARDALESAQRQWLKEHSDTAAAELETKLSSYRKAYLASLEARYAR